MRRRPLPNRWQRILHPLLIVFGWCLFAWFWWKELVAQDVDPRSIMLLSVASAVALPAVTMLWILHNRSLYRRKGPRKTVREIDATYEQDWSGRPVHADWEALKQARVVAIRIDESGKHFTPR